MMRKPGPQPYPRVYTRPNLYCGPNPEAHSQTELHQISTPLRT